MAAGLERSNRRTGHNANMRYTIWLLETLRASQMAVSSGQLADRFEQARTIEEGTDYVQFPAETLAFRNGSSRDFSLLAAACLEGVGINCAFIKTENDLLLAVSLDITQAAAETLFNNTDKILIVDDNVWLPLSMTAFNEGFNSSWTKGAGILKQAFAGNETMDFVILHDAWTSYPPAPLPELGRSDIRTDISAATAAVNSAMQTYIQQEINPIIQRTLAQTNSAAQQNRLGILYARAGRIPEAKAAYERAAGLGSVPAMTNRGSLALTENDYSTAEKWFTQALQREPKNASALRGMTQVQGNR